MVTNPGKPTVDRGHRDAVAAGLDRLCEWAVKARSAPLPDAVRRRAALVVSDDIAAMVVAASEPQVSAAQERILSPGGKAEATVFGASRKKAPRSLAAAANGLALPWAELDEGYRPLPCHAGGYTLPALLAEAEAENASVHDMLRALCISYEITTRIAHTFPFDNLTIHPHGAFNAIGAAAGVAVLRGYNATLLRDTLTSAATMVCAGPFNHAIEGALARNTWTGLGAIAGFQAADFAPLGITGLRGALYDVYATGLQLPGRAAGDGQRARPGRVGNRAWLSQDLRVLPVSALRRAGEHGTGWPPHARNRGRSSRSRSRLMRAASR